MADIKYMITSAMDQFNKQLNLQQRASSLFSEAPTIAGKVLRRGTTIALTEAQYLLHKAKIDAKVKAGAITITIVGEDGQVKVSTQTDASAPLTIPSVEVNTTNPPNGLFESTVIDDSIKLGEEVTKEVLGAVAPEIPLADVDAAISVINTVVLSPGVSVSPDQPSTPTEQVSKKSDKPKKPKGA